MSVPILRFKNDAGLDFPDWEMTNIGDILSIYSGFAFSSSDSQQSGVRWLKIADVGIQVMTPDNPSYLPIEFKNKYKKFLVYKNDYVIALTRPILNGRLKIAKVDQHYDESLLNQRVGKLITHNHIDFIYQILQLRDTVSNIADKISGTDPPNLSLNEIKSIGINITSSLDEQSKIADFLTAVDEKITQLTQKCELLTQYKKGVMQKIFSQELRFKDDDGQDFPEWEEAGFDELFYVANNKKIQIKSSDYLEQGNTPIVDQGQKHIVGYTNNTEIYKDVPVIIFGDHTRILKWIDFVFASGADGTQLLKSTDKLNLKFGYYALCHIELPNLGYSRHMKELKNQFIIIPTSIVEHTAGR